MNRIRLWVLCLPIALVVALAGSGQCRDDFTGREQKILPEYASKGLPIQRAVHRQGAVPPTYQILAAWNVPNWDRRAQPHPEIWDSNQLRAVAVDCGALRGDPKRRTIILDLNTAQAQDKDLVRAGLRFFWQPRFDKGADLGENAHPRLELIVEPLKDLKGFYETKSLYPLLDRNEMLPARFQTDEMPGKGLKHLLALWQEVGGVGKGKLQLLLERGRRPEYLMVAWLSDEMPWVKPRLVSPALPEVLYPEIVQLLPTLSNQSNVAELPTGTWKLIEEGRRRELTLVSLGREGLVMGNDVSSGKEPYYEVHLMQMRSGSLVYAPKPRITKGLSKTPARRWTRHFPIPETWDASQARHLVALSVCSPEVWRRTRNSNGAPHFAALFADPELWALPE